MATEEVKFKNRDGLVITTSNPETINNYRMDERFTEVKSRSSSSTSGSSSKRTTRKSATKKASSTSSTTAAEATAGTAKS